MSPIEIRVRGIITARGYARTYQIADKLGVTTPFMRRRMLVLERRGVVRRDARSSAVNDICWVLAPEDGSQTPPASDGEGQTRAERVQPTEPNTPPSPMQPVSGETEGGERKTSVENRKDFSEPERGRNEGGSA